MVNIFGAGFVGGEYRNQYPCIVNSREDYTPKTNNILYMISTIHNYHVFDDPFIDIDTNLVTLIKVLDQSRKKYGSDFVFNFVSSWFVYGDVSIPVMETSVCKPKGFYSITKKTAEDLLISYCETFKINYRILRLANIIGPQDKKVSDKKNALQYLIQRLKNNEEIKLYNGGNFFRDYIDVVDAVRAIHLVLNYGQFNDIYNISNGTALLYKDLIDYVVDKTKTSSKIINIEPSDFHKIVQVKSMVIDNTKLKALGYSPSLSIQQSLDKIIYDEKN